MSHEATTHVIKLLREAGAATELRPIDRLVLLLVADRHNPDERMARPSIRTVAREAGVTDRHVRDSTARLERAGILRRIPRFVQYDDDRNPRQTSNGYQFAGLDDGNERAPAPAPERRRGRHSATAHPRQPSAASPRQPSAYQEPVTQNLLGMNPSGEGDVQAADAALRRRIADGWRNETGKTRPLNAAQMSDALDLLARAIAAGNEPAFWRVMHEAALGEWTFAGFLGATRDELAGTRRTPASSRSSGYRNSSAQPASRAPAAPAEERDAGGYTAAERKWMAEDNVYWTAWYARKHEGGTVLEREAAGDEAVRLYREAARETAA